MIAQILDANFVKKRVPELVELLYRKSAKWADVPAALKKERVAPNHIRAAAKWFGEVAASPEFQTDEAAWMPRDPYLAVVQSVLEEYYRNARAVDGNQKLGLAGDLPDVTGESLKPEWMPHPTRGFAREMEESDWLGWALSFAAAKAVWSVKRKHPFRVRKSGDLSAEMGPKTRLVLAGDWGSGVARALEIGTKMRASLAETPDADRHFIHLGDVYYAGREFEYKSRFLNHWPVDEDQTIGSWNLNANHDMFTGGHGYFQCLDSDARFERQRGHSYFALENEHWIVAGLDTAWEAEGPKGDRGGLQAPQIDWLLALRRRSPHKRLILMSHHQPFSLFEGESPLLQERVEPLLKSSSPIDAWFWGHEHRCAVYGGFHNIAYPALIGHAGVPVYMSKKKRPVRFEIPDVLVGGLSESFSLMGYAVVDLDGPRATVSYTDEFRANRVVHTI